MNQYIGGISKPSTLFFKDANGDFIPLMDIQQVDTISDMKEHPEDVYQTFRNSVDLCFSIQATPKSARRMKKLVNSIRNRVLRSRRTMLRRREKERRARLKRG